MDPYPASDSRFSGRFDSPHNSPKALTATSGARRALRGLLALAGATLLICGGDGRLFAQESPYEQPEPQVSYAYQTQAYPPEGGASLQGGPMSSGQLEQLVAPIALYPDPLVAQILAASTYPPQVAEADRWRQEQGYASPDQIAAGADAQPWDPSVKALTAFPQVLAQMDRNLQWTTDLGNAYYNQPQDVLEAVQVMRHRAEAAGSLRSTPQQLVRYDSDNIELVPASPQVVYVPAYNPWAVYGEPVSPYPGFSLLGAIGEFFSAGPLRYGLGIAMSAFTHTPWGWLAWGLNWLTQAVLFNHDDYYSHSASVADWGFPHHGLHAYAGRGGYGRFSSYGMRGGEGWRHGEGRGHGEGWGHGESWKHGGPGGSEWHSFGRESGMHGNMHENWGGRSGRGFEAFQGNSGWRSAGRKEQGKGAFRSDALRSSYFRSTRENSGRPLQASRGSMTQSQRGGFRERSMGSFGSRNFMRSSAKPNSGGHHLFGGGNSHNNFGGGHSGGFHSGGGGHAPKGFGGGRSFGGGKNFGGGHSRGGGGHSSGHGGGGHHHH